MRVRAKRFLTVGVVLTVGGVLLMLTTFAGAASGKAQHVSWDIIHFTTTTVPPTVTFDPGGFAEAETPSPAGTFGPIETIRLTGHGTFVASAGNGHGSGAATGGGTWSIDGGQTTHTYEVTGLVSWEFASLQSPIPGLVDNTGDINERANGTAVLKVEFSDGQSGVLTVGCHGPGAPNHIFEGIATTKGFKTYYDVHDPVGGVDANRTVFHVRG